MRGRLRLVATFPKALGWFGTLRFAIWHYLGWPGGPTYVLQPRQAAHPLLLRAKTSDAAVFFQIFLFDVIVRVWR